MTNHGDWAKDIEETQGHKVNYPMIGDPELKVAKLYDMLPAEAGDTSEGRTAADNATVRTVFVVGPDKKIKLMLAYPMSTGRNFDEILRVAGFDAAHGEAQGRDAGELEERRRLHHCAGGERRRGQGEVSGRLEDGEAVPPGCPAAEIQVGGLQPAAGLWPLTR